MCVCVRRSNTTALSNLTCTLLGCTGRHIFPSLLEAWDNQCMSVAVITIPCHLVFQSARLYSTRSLSLVIRHQRPYHMASAPIDNATASPEIDLSQFTPVTEGKATILFPKGNEVFYNPVQEFNRDMSVAAIRTWSEMFLGEKRARIEKKVANSKGNA